MSDSALRELADDPSSRKRFLAMAGGAGAASAFAILLSACGDDEDGASELPTSTATSTNSQADPRGDIEILNFALTLEHLEAGFYAQVVESGLVKKRSLADLARRFGETEAAHVDKLTKAIKRLGGTPVEAPETRFEPIFAKGVDEVLGTAANVENLGAAAYLGQASAIQDQEVLALALSIHSVEARHAAALNELIGRGFEGADGLEGSLPDGSAARGLSMDEVLERVKPFLAA